jgi:hypothetical protein
MRLIEEFNSEIGLKSLTLEGFCTLGTRVMYEPLMLCKHSVML